MRTYHSNEIGNVVVLGHSGSGKTSVIEAMAYRAGLRMEIRLAIIPLKKLRDRHQLVYQLFH